MAATFAKLERALLPTLRHTRPPPLFRSPAPLPIPSHAAAAARRRGAHTTSHARAVFSSSSSSLSSSAQGRRTFSHAPPRRLFRNQPPSEEEIRWRLRGARPLVPPGGLGRFVRSPSTYTVALLAAAAAVAFYFANLQTVPVSGRRRFNCYSSATVEAVGDQQVKHIVYDVERQGGRFLSDWDPRTQMVKRVMRRLIPVSGMEDSDWQVWVIDDPRRCARSLTGESVSTTAGELRYVAR
jgi:metalloendopeptidase OMA1, mitochondrial